jgi:hypothetical protein
MNNQFKFNSNGIEYSVRPQNPDTPNVENFDSGNDITEKVANGNEDIKPHHWPFEKFWPQINFHPRPLTKSEIDQILLYSQLELGGCIISKLFEQFHNSGLHEEYIERIIENCIENKQYNIILDALNSEYIDLNDNQKIKLTKYLLNDCNVKTIIDNLDFLIFTPDLKNKFLEKPMSGRDLDLILAQTDELKLDYIQKNMLIDRALNSQKVKSILNNLNTLKPNLDQVNLLIDNIPPKSWGAFTALDLLSQYDLEIIKLSKLEEKLGEKESVDSNLMSRYFELHESFNLDFDYMYALCLQNVEKVQSNGNDFKLDFGAISFVIDYANTNITPLPVDKIKKLMKYKIDNGGNLYTFFKNDNLFKLDISFLGCVKTTNGFDINTLRTKFDLSPEELKTYFEENCKYSDPKRLNRIDRVLHLDSSSSIARGAIFNEFNNEFIIMNEANRRNGGKLDSKMAQISKAFGSQINIESYLLGRSVLDGTDPDVIEQLKRAGLNETGEVGLDQLEKEFGKFKSSLLKPEMTIAELKNIRQKLEIPLFQHYFVSFTRQSEGQFGNKTTESLLSQMDYLIGYYEKNGVSDLEIVGELKEGYENADIKINKKVKQEISINAEVIKQLDDYKNNMEKALDLFRNGFVNDRPSYRLFQFAKAGKQLITNLNIEAQKNVNEFDPEKIIEENNTRIAEAKEAGTEKKVKITDPAKVLIGLRQKVKKLGELKTLLSSKTPSGKEYISPKVILDNWVELFSELSNYKKNPKVKNFLQQLLFAEYFYEYGETLVNINGPLAGNRIDDVEKNLEHINDLDLGNPDILVLEKTLEIVTHLINQEFWKNNILEQQNRVIETPQNYKPPIPRLPGYNGLNLHHMLNPLNKRFASKLHKLKPNSDDQVMVKKFEESHKSQVSKAVNNMDSILGLNSIKDFVDTVNRNVLVSEEKVTWNLQPVRGYLFEVSGKLCDACWADKYDSVNQSFPGMTFVNISSQTADNEAKLEGGFLLMEVAGANGEKILTIRGLNPLMASIDSLVAKSIVENIIEFTKATASRIKAIPAIVIDDHTGGSCTNRPAIQSYCQHTLASNLEKIQVLNDSKSNFNGYNISDWVYRLDKQIIDNGEVDKDEITD